MCDTLAATPESTATHAMIVGKNSDRHRNEAQVLERFEPATYGTDAQVRCTYITIPQARRTHGVLLSRPFWIWGAEMGANDHGVFIANEGLHARIPAPKQAALTGMDLVRLGLERAATAAEAAELVTQLLAQHGQGGDCGYLTASYYHNGFLLADAREAFVVETVEREWAMERVHRVRALSNQYSIGKDSERVSLGLPAIVRDLGGSELRGTSLAEVIGDPNREHIGQAGARRTRSTMLLRSQEGSLSVASLCDALRDHGEHSDRHWHPQRASSYSICMHAGTEERFAQTTASWVSELQGGRAVHWVTGTSAPCTSIYKPVLLGVPIPPHGPRATARSSPESLWWKHEQLHRSALMGDFGSFLAEIQLERAALEAVFRERIAHALEDGVASIGDQVARCWKDALDAEGRWTVKIRARSGTDDSPYKNAWAKASHMAGMI